MEIQRSKPNRLIYFMGIREHRINNNGAYVLGYVRNTIMRVWVAF